MESRISFSDGVGKRKTKLEVGIPFSHIVGKRLALWYTHCMLFIFQKNFQRHEVSCSFAFILSDIHSFFLRSTERNSNSVMLKNSRCVNLSAHTNLASQKFLQGRMTSCPCSSMCFLSSVAQYCGLAGVEEAYCGLYQILKLFI